MPYINDVFISYKREFNWTPWTRDHFKSLLQSYLQQDLGRSPGIFIDERLEKDFGQDWVLQLAENLAQSRVSVVVFSLDYFNSSWCLHELDLMLARARLAGGQPSQFIIPVIGHDGELIPDAVARLMPCDVKRFRIAQICAGTPLYQDFSISIAALSPSIARAINTAPAFDDSWVPTCRDRFNAVFEAQRRGEHLEPREFVLRRSNVPNLNPRLVV